MKLGIMGSESYLMGGNPSFLVFWKITSYSVWSIMYALMFACSKSQGISDKTTLQETQSEGA